MEKLKNIIHLNQKFIIYLLLAILASSIFTIFMFNSNTSPVMNNNDTILENNTPVSEFDFLEDVALKINDINSSFSSSTSFYIDNTDSIIMLENNISDLNTIKDYLSSFIVTEDNTREILPLINKSVASTINLYNTCLLSLTNDLTISQTDYISEIKTLQTSCSTEYEKLLAYNLELDFSYESISFFENLYNHLDSIYDDNKHLKIKESQIADFISHVKSNLSDFPLLLQDLSPAISQIRTDNRDLNIILDDIKDKELLFLSIKDSTLATSVPEGYSSVYENIVHTFNLYSNYVNSLKIAIVYENSSSYEDNKDNIHTNYDNAFSKLEDVISSYDSLIKSLDNL